MQAILKRWICDWIICFRTFLLSVNPKSLKEFPSSLYPPFSFVRKMKKGSNFQIKNVFILMNDILLIKSGSGISDLWDTFDHFKSEKLFEGR